MSVINRMLQELEARGGDRAAAAPAMAAVGAEQPGARRRGNAARVALAAALVGVAAALWWQQTPWLAAQARNLLGAELVGATLVAQDSPVGATSVAQDPPLGATSIAQDSPVGATSVAQDAAAPSSTQTDRPAITAPPETVAHASDDGKTALAPAGDPLAAELVGVSFSDSASERVVLRLDFAGEPPAVVPPANGSDRLTLRLPATADGLAVPRPPGGQSLVDRITVDPGDGWSDIRLDVTGNARVGLQRAGDRALDLVVRAPADAEPEAQAQTVTETRDQESATRAEEQTAASTSVAATDAASDPVQETQASDGQADTASNGTDAGERGNDSGSTAEAQDEEPAAADASGGSMAKEDTTPPEVRAQRRFRAARDALAAGDARRAQRLLEQALDLDGDLHAARDTLVTLHRRRGDNGSARDVLAQGVDRAPQRLAYVKPYARLLAAADQVARAREVLEAARPSGAGDAEFHALAANMNRRAGEHRAAIADYTAALEADPNQGKLWLGLGISLAAEDHDNEALEAFREARATGRLSGELDRWAERRIEALSGS